MVRRTVYGSIVAAALWFAAAGSASASSWKLDFQDYFTGTKLNAAEWRQFSGTGFLGHGLRRPAQVQVKNGRLEITAQMINGVLHSGGVWHLRNYRYGRFEVRVRTAVDPSAATSGVVLTWPQSGNQAREGENDIYETGAYRSRRPFYSFVHFPGGQFNIIHEADASQWHTMIMEWEPGTVRIYRDGVLARRITDANRLPTTTHLLSMQLDALKNSVSGPVRMDVEYVRIFRRVP